MNPLRRAWAAVSRPRSFYASLSDRPALATAAATAALSAVVGTAALALVVARATASDAWLPWLLGVPALLLPYLTLIALLGGLVLMRPAGLDLRAWEIVAWAWVPAGFVGVSLLPIGLLAPWPALVVGASLLPLWHLWLVWSGTETFAAGRPRLATTLYGVTVFGLPLLLVGFTAVVLSTLAG